MVINKLKNKDFDNFFRQYMKVLNLSFDDYEVEYDEENNPRISVIYKTIKGVYKSRLEDESMGFNRMLFLALDIFDSLTYGRTLVIDGLGKYINYTLQHAIVTMFLDPNINVNNSQLVFTTNDIKLLSSSLLRRDEIYFVEKDEITNVSKVFCLSKFFAVRKHENIEKGYLTGRYIKSPIRDNITLKIKKASI